MNIIGRNIDRALRVKRLSRKEVAAELKIPQSTLSKWISGKQEPRASALMRLARVIGVPIESIICDGEEHVLGALLEELEERFIEIGTYRIRIERQVLLPKANGGRK